MEFLKKARKGISINIIIDRRPTNIFAMDSCENGIGGFSAETGKAFRHEITNNLRFKVSNNVIEFLSEVIDVWLGSLNDEVK